MSYFDELLHFCREHEEIYCYGAGDYGTKVLQFLKKNDIHINAFLISDGEKGERDSIPVIVVDNIDFKIDPKSGVILSLSERHHDDVRYKLQQMGIKDIFAISLDDIRYKITKEISDISLYNEFINEKGDSQYLVRDYRKRAEELLEQYSVVELQYIFLRHIGGLANWMYLSQLRQQDKSNRYFLYFPTFFYEKNFPNNFLMSKLNGNGIEVINPDTLPFWQFFATNYASRFHANNGYSAYCSSDNYNQFVSNGEMNLDVKYINFSDPEISKGREILKELGLSEYVCVANRDSAYRREVMKIIGETEDIVDIYRNSEIENFELTSQQLKKMNISAVRMGARVERALDNNSTIIDYTSKMHSDFADAYLFSECKFIISDSSGIQVLAKLFAKPSITINTAVFTTKVDSLLPSHENYDLMILQKYWDPKNNRYLTIREMIEMEINGEKEKLNIHRPANTYLVYHEKGIKPVKNTPEEIWDVAREMLQRLDGTVKYDELDLQLKDKFDSIKREYTNKGHFFFNMRIGRDFLRQNQWLLE